MKKPSKKLALHTETVRQLADKDVASAAGGLVSTVITTQLPRGCGTSGTNAHYLC